MKATTIDIQGPVIIEPQVFRDSRGYFFESYNEERFAPHIGEQRFVQDNQSLSQQGTLRGLHFQAPPFEQGKLVRVIKGAVLDVIVDIRKASPTFGQHYAIELSEENFKMFWIPPGFAHGFLTLRNDTLFAYKCTGVYNKAAEGGLLWSDPALQIAWNVNEPIISDKDQVLPLLKDLQSPF